MEQRYWEQFMKTGGICDYLGYKMEVYGHSKGKDDRQEACQSPGAVILPLYPQNENPA